MILTYGGSQVFPSQSWLFLSQYQLFHFDTKTLFFLFLWFFNKFHFLGQIFPNIFSGSFVLLVGPFDLPTNWSLKIGSVTKSESTISLANRYWIRSWRYECSRSFLRIIPLLLVLQYEPTMFKLKDFTIVVFIQSLCVDNLKELKEI